MSISLAHKVNEKVQVVNPIHEPNAQGDQRKVVIDFSKSNGSSMA